MWYSKKQSMLIHSKKLVDEINTDIYKYITLLQTGQALVKTEPPSSMVTPPDWLVLAVLSITTGD